MRTLVIGGIAASAIVAGYVTFPASARAQPPGSYLQTCHSVRASRGTLTAQCLDARGRRITTSLAYSGCQGDIANHNGVLTCEGVGRGNSAFAQPEGNFGRPRQGGVRGNTGR